MATEHDPRISLEDELSKVQTARDVDQEELRKLRGDVTSAARRLVGAHLVRLSEMISERIARALEDGQGERVDDLAEMLLPIWRARWELHLAPPNDNEPIAAEA